MQRVRTLRLPHQLWMPMIRSLYLSALYGAEVSGLANVTLAQIRAAARGALGKGSTQSSP
eukprot:308479-Amphidinium_carterae.1